MITLLSEIHFWTTQEDVIIKPTDYGSFKYSTKKDAGDTINIQAKKQYCELRNIVYNPNNKRPHKLKDRLKELEEYLVHNKVVCYSWNENKLKLLLSTGLIVSITLNNRTGDLISIVFDKQLSAKLQVNIICDGVIFGSQVICICNDGHVLGFGGQWKDGWVLEGGPRRKLNYHGDWLAVWGKAGAEHPQPWSPLAKDHQRANLHLYWIGARDPELLSYKKTDGEPLQVVVSKTCNRTLIMVEQKVTQRGAVSVEISTLELIGNNLKRVSVTSVPLQTQVSCSALSDNEERLIIGCIDSSLALLDRNRGSTLTVKASFIPTLATWHPEGALIAISNERGMLQYYDTALNCVKTQIIGEDCIPSAILDLSGYFNMQFSVASINWGPKDLMFSLEQGPLLLLKHVDGSLTFKSLAQRYLSMGKVDKAIKLLLSWDFNEKVLFVLQKVTASLMRQPLTEENARHLQNALGSFHNAPVPLPTQIRHRHGGQVMSLTRRFFHQLVRANMFETAFLLAVDVGHHDLFMDLYYIAVKIGETEMAAAARAQASALLSRCSSEASNCSRSSCSQCSDSQSSSSSGEFQPNASKQDKDFTTPIALNPDNVLTTDFNQPNPTTYNINHNLTDNKEIPQSISNNIKSNDNLRVNYTPRATYVKAPQVPPNFTKLPPPNSNSNAPPLPFHTSLGIPLIPHSANQMAINGFNSNLGYKPATSNIYTNSSAQQNNINFAFTSSTSNNVSVTNIKNSFTPIHLSNNTNKLVPPPLPNLSSAFSTPCIPTSSLHNSTDNVASLHSTSRNFLTSSNADLCANSSSGSSTTSFLTSDIYTSCSVASGSCALANAHVCNKKNQTKVKFSDTVTAFIVPEIKRPVRPAPPPHVTDPQKELADSLPLCHPNEDYLKDFAPVRKNEEEGQDGSSSGQSAQPKIKVVHFGVV